jgi:hypothetical protein
LTGWVFVDESKRHDYLLVAVSTGSIGTEYVRRTMRSLVLPGQYRLHMKDERDARKRSIATAICTCAVRAVVYDAGRRYRNERERREACLRGLVADLAVGGDDVVVVLEEDETLVAYDRAVLFRAVQSSDCAELLSYRHSGPAGEPMLWVPDAIAWCWAKGGDWRRRIAPVIAGVRDV